MRRTLAEGRYGWQVTDCTVTLTHSGFVPPSAVRLEQLFQLGRRLPEPDPAGADDRADLAGTTVLEPMHWFRLEIPADMLGAVLPALAPLRAVPAGSPRSGARCACWKATSRRRGCTVSSASCRR